jgi:C4-dicarboxylate-specific signal transduction histidine kinase
VRKATQIISHLRTFGRAAPVTHEVVSVMQVIQSALSLMGQQLNVRHIDVALDPCGEDPRVFGNPIQLEQVFINLLSNARDALQEAPRKQIQVTCSANQGKVLIRFLDTGVGIPEGMEQRIFDPFFTTKEVGKGTGLGLSITYGIIQDHKGTISVVKRAPGEGAEFLIELPLADAGEADANGGTP